MGIRRAASRVVTSTTGTGGLGESRRSPSVARRAGLRVPDASPDRGVLRSRRPHVVLVNGAWPLDFRSRWVGLADSTLRVDSRARVHCLLTDRAADPVRGRIRRRVIISRVHRCFSADVRVDEYAGVRHEIEIRRLPGGRTSAVEIFHVSAVHRCSSADRSLETCAAWSFGRDRFERRGRIHATSTGGMPKGRDPGVPLSSDSEINSAHHVHRTRRLGDRNRRHPCGVRAASPR